jgi:hypothetical protein
MGEYGVEFDKVGRIERFKPGERPPILPPKPFRKLSRVSNLLVAEHRLATLDSRDLRYQATSLRPSA